MRAPTFYWKKRTVMTRASVNIIYMFWGVGAVFGLFPFILPQDEYKTYPFGLTLSVTFDRYMIYETLLIVGVLTLWILNLACFYEYVRNRSESRLKPTSKASQHSKKLLLSNLFASIISLTICYFPLIITQSMSQMKTIDFTTHTSTFNADQNKSFNTAMLISSRCVLFNSFLNSVVYGIRSKNIHWQNILWWRQLSYKSNAQNSYLHNLKERIIVRTVTRFDVSGATKL